MNPIHVALWCAIPLAIGVSIDSLELISDRLQLADGGLYGYPVLATARELTLTGPLATMFRLVFSYPAVLSLPAVQLAAAALLLVAAVVRAPPLIVPAGIAVLVILAARLLLVLRSPMSRDAGDSMTFVVCTGVAVCLLVSNQSAQNLALYYIASQLLLSYIVAGTAKAVSPTWRSGDAIPGVLNTIGHGSPTVGVFLKRHASLSRALCWSVVMFECSAVALLFLGTPGAIVIIAAGLCFHISIAALMGINSFVWSFGATYPALLQLAHTVGTLWH